MTKEQIKELIKAKSVFLESIEHSGEVFNRVTRDIEELQKQLEGEQEMSSNPALQEETEELLDLTEFPQEKEASEEELIILLKQECDEKGIKYHHFAGIPKLTELLK